MKGDDWQDCFFGLNILIRFALFTIFHYVALYSFCFFLLQVSLTKRDGDISWTVTSRGHYFLKWATFRGHSQRVTSRGHYFSKWVTFRGQF